jgi:hypothetical protein
LATEGFDGAHLLTALLDDGDDIALAASDFVGGFLDGIFEAGDEEKKEGCNSDGDQREVPIEPEHNGEDADDRQKIDEDRERGGGCEVLDGDDVVGDRAQECAGLMRVVVGKREALEVVVDAHAEIVGDVLADAFRVVVVDIAGDGAEGGDEDVEDGGEDGEAGLAVAQRKVVNPIEPFGERAGTDDIVDDAAVGRGAESLSPLFCEWLMKMSRDRREALADIAREAEISD